MNLSAQPADPLADCAQEPIRIPGAIQPHGALMLVREADLIMLQISENLAATLKLPLAADADRSVEKMLGERLEGDLRQWLGSDDPLYLKQHEIAGNPFSVSGHRARQGVILEIEAGGSGATADSSHPLLRRFMEQSDPIAEVDAICTLAARHFQALTGFNRVMIYKFDRDWNGTVLAEHGDGVLPSYLDLRFPASDIPAQARELYRLNRLRLIPTATYQPVPLSPPLCPVDGEPLDLSFAALRSVSPGPSRIYAQHGYGGVDVGVDRHRRGIVGTGIVPSCDRPPCRAAAASSLRLPRPDPGAADRRTGARRSTSPSGSA